MILYDMKISQQLLVKLFLLEMSMTNANFMKQLMKQS